jgi:hypothetical protein
MSAPAVISRPHVVEATAGFCVMFRDGGSLGFDDPAEARELAAVILQGAAGLEARQAARAVAKARADHETYVLEVAS